MLMDIPYTDEIQELIRIMPFISDGYTHQKWMALF